MNMEPGSRGRTKYPVRMGEMPEISQDTVVKWVIVPGATVAALFVFSKLLKRKRRKK